MTLKPGDIVWVRGEVAQITPNAILVTMRGPGGAPIPYPLDPEGAIMPDDPKTPSA